MSATLLTPHRDALRLIEMLLPIVLAETGKAPQRVQLLRVGQFRDHEQGAFEITPEMLSSFVKNFDEKVRGYDDGHLPIDYFHESERVAAGWITKLAIEGTGKDASLWADVKWTPAGAQKVADAELRYLSIEFHPDYVPNEGDEKSFGPTVFGAGMTNRPFVKRMKPVKALSEGASKMDLQQALAMIEQLKAELAKYKPADAGAAQAGAVPPAAQTAMAERDAARKELAEVKAAAETAAKKAAFTRLLAEGKAVPAQEESFLAGDMIKFTELAKPLNLDGKGNAGDGQADKSEKSAKGGVKLAEGEDVAKKVIEMAKARAAADSISFTEATNAVLRENPELNAAYRKVSGVKLTA